MVNEVYQLLQELNNANVKLWVQEGILRSSASKGAITPVLRKQIQQHRDTIISFLQSTEAEELVSQQHPIPKVEERPSYALSNAQRRLWVLHQMDEGLSAYNMPVALRLAGRLDTAALEQAFALLFERHEILRTRFVAVNGEGRQVVDPAGDFKLPIQDARAWNEDQIREHIQAHARLVFDLEHEHLLQVELLQTDAEEWLLLFNMHHIISDGWSMEILVREWSRLYEACRQDAAEPLAQLQPLPIQYKDYAAWQNNLLEADETVHKLRDYWQGQLADLPTLELPADYPRPAVKTYNGASRQQLFSREITRQLQELSQQQGATLFMTLTALVKVLLYRYTNQTDIVLGTPSAGRTHPDLHDQIGFYVNTLVLRTQLEGEQSFTALLQQVKATALAAFEHELYPFDRLVEELDVPRDMSRSAVFDVMIVLQNNEQSRLELGDVAIEFEPVQADISKFDLTFSFAESEAGLEAAINYNTDLLRADRVERMFEHLETLIQSVLQAPDHPIEHLDILPEAEKALLLHAFNDTGTDYPADKTIAELFEEQVERTPDNIAVVFGQTELTYRELNARANRVAHYLREAYGIQPDDVIALQLERSEWMIVAILSVLKSGAAYLPIAPDAPGARVRYMLENSRAKALLTDEATYAAAKEYEVIVPVDVIQRMNATGRSPSTVHRSPSSLAYIIYTSGSTGQPKGVMIEHQALLNLIHGHQCFYKHYPTPLHIALVADYTFDGSIKTLFGSLCLGHTLFPIANELKTDGGAFVSFLARQSIQAMDCTPSLFNILLDGGLARRQDLNLKLMLIGGEALPIDLLKRFYQNGRRTSITIYNLYGPTEATVNASYHEVPESRLQELNAIPIGQALPNYSLYILSREGSLQPIGVTGELLIGGAGLARGYLNNPELTAEKFIPHPFKPGERLYRTGDLARWLPDGNIEFLGRIDHQLKIRGYRIEAGEIEQILLQHHSIQSAVVIGKEMGQVQELVAYLTTGGQELSINVENLRQYLSEHLPDYMIPSYFLTLEALPLTTSGKVDRGALPGLKTGGLATGNTYVAPRNTTETTLVNIWGKVLSRTSIGIYDNFFDLGGHSLRAIQLIAAIAEKLDANIPLKLIFQCPTIAALAEKISEHKDHLYEEEICYNTEASSTLFAFPPGFGLAVFYERLAALCPQVAWYCFDFLEIENRLEHYYRQIKQRQPEGPYVFFGYSIGGNLAFEMARFMESKGEVVSDVILGDSSLRLALLNFDFNGELSFLSQNEEVGWQKKQSLLLQNEIFLKQTERRMRAYFNFLRDPITERFIQANIHQLKAEETAEEAEERRFLSSDWTAQTKGLFIVYPARGIHRELFNSSPYLEANAAIILMILERIQLVNYTDVKTLLFKQ
ncbi:MAG: amino acid adenylation domain-containing protein [Lewinellaceae bacterium]|nr:amino acid adenylation domain-containing protein [Phaeodactylibacter sp.]MCB9348852.1 amino acid adenylation domain-containing protein [Lewinellaceae bacterium]